MANTGRFELTLNEELTKAMGGDPAAWGTAALKKGAEEGDDRRKHYLSRLPVLGEWEGYADYGIY